MWIRDDRQAALNAVESACLQNADGYAAAAARALDAELATRFDESARRLRALACDLAAHIRALGDLPQTPDPDLETFGQVLDTLKAQLAADGDAILLEQRMTADSELELAIRSALELDLPEDTRTLLARLREEIARLRRRLLQTRH